MKYGYAWVFTDGQSVDAPVRQPTRAGCKKVYRDVARGAEGRPRRAAPPVAELKVTRLDRLARSIRDLLDALAQVTVKEAGFTSLADAWADTRTQHGG